VADDSAGDRNPYAAPGSPTEPHPGDGKPRTGGPPPAFGTPASAGGGVSPEQRAAALRKARGTVLLGMVAVFAGFFVAPLGIALGVLVIIRAMILRHEVARARIGGAPITVSLASGIVAIVSGVVISVVGLVFAEELLDFRECLSGANTEIAKDACYAELRDALSGRLG
jgi:hypothetical protein